MKYRQEGKIWEAISFVHKFFDRLWNQAGQDAVKFFRRRKQFLIEKPRCLLNSGERIPRSRFLSGCCGVSEQNTKKVPDGIGFLVSFAARSFNSGERIPRPRFLSGCCGEFQLAAAL